MRAKKYKRLRWYPRWRASRYAASAGIASLIEDEYQIFIARKNFALNAVAVLFEVELNGIVVGNL